MEFSPIQCLPSNHETPIMTNPTKKEMFEAGLKIRKEVLGVEHVERSFAVKDVFSEDVQDYLTTHAWARPGRGATPMAS